MQRSKRPPLSSMNPQGRWGDTRWMILTLESCVGAPRTDPTCFPEGEDMDVLAAYADGRVRLAPTL